MKNVSEENILALWRLLAEANLQELQSRPWIPGKAL
jgi:hypothetical protein